MTTNVTTKKPLIAPMPNLNGNSALSLVEQLQEYLDGLRHAQDALMACYDYWHGRNFQTLPNGEQLRRDAQDAWLERMNILSDLHTEAVNIAIQVQNRGGR